PLNAILLKLETLSDSWMVMLGEPPVVFTKNPCPGWMYWFNPTEPEKGDTNVTVPVELTVTYPPVALRLGSHPQKVLEILLLLTVAQSIGDANGLPSNVNLFVTPVNGIVELVL